VRFHFDNNPRRGSNPLVAIVMILFASLVGCVALASLVMSVCCSSGR